MRCDYSERCFNAAMLQDLLEYHEKEDAPCRKYITPLQAAIPQNKEEMTWLLLDYDADLSSFHVYVGN
jgi:hypothetical protein